jgi:hypothetical protein
MKKGSNTRNISTLVVATTLLMAATAHAATPAQTCESGKNGAAGKYALCLLKAQAKFVKGGEVDAAGYDAAVLKCDAKYGGKWQSLETKAGGMCPSTGDETSIQDFLDACIFSAEDALGGGVLPSDVVTCNADLGTCTGSLGTCTGNLATCNGNLATCNSDLSSTNADLGVCNGDLGNCTASLGTCTGDLATCNGNLATCNSDLSSTNADLTTCSGDLATANSGTAAAGDVLSGKTFTSTAGLGATGTMPNNGGVTLTPTTSDQAIAAGYHDGSGECAGDADLVAGNIKNGVNLFGVTGTASAGGLQETGQTLCYNTGGTVIACAGTGQDGELQKGVANSFTDNGDGTITDNLTGLMWEKLSDDGTIHDKDTIYTWANAFADKVATLNSTVFAGYSDWRVPNAKELQTLQNFGAVNPATFTAFNTACSAACTVLTCSCTRSYYYWSSTTYQYFPSSAWIVSFNYANTSNGNKTDSYSVRAVRAGS